MSQDNMVRRREPYIHLHKNLMKVESHAFTCRHYCILKQLYTTNFNCISTPEAFETGWWSFERKSFVTKRGAIYSFISM